MSKAQTELCICGGKIPCPRRSTKHDTEVHDWCEICHKFLSIGEPKNRCDNCLELNIIKSYKGPLLVQCPWCKKFELECCIRNGKVVPCYSQCYTCFKKGKHELSPNDIELLDTDSEDDLTDVKKEDFGIVSEEDINEMNSDDLREWSIEQDYKHKEEELIKNNKTLQLLRRMLNLLEKMKVKPMCKEEISIFNAYFDNLDAIRRNIIDDTVEINRRRKISDKLD